MGDLLSLDLTGITNALDRPGGLWREVRVVAETGSTNADLLAQDGAGAAEGLVRGPDISVPAVTQRHAQPAGEE